MFRLLDTFDLPITEKQVCKLLQFSLFKTKIVNLAYSNLQASFNSQDEWKQIVDPVVQATCCKESLSVVIAITNKCISTESWSRPSIEDVLWNLQYASQVQTTAEGEKRI